MAGSPFRAESRAEQPSHVAHAISFTPDAGFPVVTSVNYAPAICSPEGAVEGGDMDVFEVAMGVMSSWHASLRPCYSSPYSVLIRSTSQTSSAS